ncbi:MAG: hypothetical protein ACD_62C00625G0004 [uncultured bacterium]|nr:MAG: hypothetical protein ACD_62C00625G0004 [uncultured bacterium]HLD45619.1 hypothetical protein [bacterium]
MVGVIIISESNACKEMLKTVGKVLNRDRLPGIYPLVLDASYTIEERLNKIQALINKADVGQGVLIMTELYGASQTNVCKHFLKGNHVKVLCGYNLPMIIEAVTLNESAALGDICNLTAEVGKKYIRCPACEQNCT